MHIFSTHTGYNKDLYKMHFAIPLHVIEHIVYGTSSHVDRLVYCTLNTLFCTLGMHIVLLTIQDPQKE